jgi:hypothetical protein
MNATEDGMKKRICIALSMALYGIACQPVWAVTPTDYTTTFTTSAYGSSGTITFNDWGYQGPSGVGANDFQVGTGFDPSQVGQIQQVITLDPNWATSDPTKDVLYDGTPPSLADPSNTLYNANMDATVNFYAWAYTTIGGSTFTDMTIDKAGNYFVAKNDMNFQFYDNFLYHAGTNPADPTQDINSSINFQPYAISDARGWCGSVLNSNPNGLAIMAGQVTFDFAFDAYLNNKHPGELGASPSPQIVPGFVMRSYGSYDVQVTVGADLMSYQGSAVGNNTNPGTSPLDGNGEIILDSSNPALDSDYQNKVSFLGAGVVPKGVWVTGDSYNPDGSRKLNPDGTWAVTVVSGATQLCNPSKPGGPGTPPVTGAVCHQNSFAGYPFLMRADGQRTLTYIGGIAGEAGAGHSNYVATDAAAYASLAPVPLPAAVWLFGSGLLGLSAVVRRNKKV